MNADLAHFVLDLVGQLVPITVQWLVQSTLLIGAGLIVARLCRRHGPALESVILRTTLVMVMLCPLVSIVLSRLGVQGRQWELPRAEALVKADSIVAERVSVSSETKASRLPLPPSSASTMSSQAATAASATSATPAIPPDATRAVNVSSRHVVAPNESLGHRVSFYALAAGVWSIVGAFLLLRLAIAHRRIARMLRESDLAEVTVFESCNAIARELAVPPPEVRVHTGIKSPLLIGLFRPAILLPDVKGLEELVATREVLLHELAHRARHDCFWHLLSRITSAALWIQPLLWLLARRIEETAEDVCDNYVIEHARDRRGYAQQLVALAEQLRAKTSRFPLQSALGTARSTSVPSIRIESNFNPRSANCQTRRMRRRRSRATFGC